MSAILPSVKIDSTALLASYFTIYQPNWIQAEEPLHARSLCAFILAEKSTRIGWTFCHSFKNVRKSLRLPRPRYLFLPENTTRIGWPFCDSFKNVRKRLRFPRRDYLFVTKDWPSSLEYMRQA